MTKTLTALLVLSLSAAALSCGDSAQPAVDSGAKLDAAAEAGQPAPIVPVVTVGGNIPAPPRDAAPEAVIPETPYEPTMGCCPTTLWIADPDGNETTAVVTGDLGPLKNGVPLVWKDGRWSATVCMPRDEQISYRFYFGKKAKPVEVDQPDAGSDAEDAEDAGGADDASAPDAGSDDAGESADADLPLVDDYRTNTEFPISTTDDGQPQNVFPAISVCGSTGM